MKAIRCDGCQSFVQYGDIVKGTLVRKAFGHLLNRYPEHYDLCLECSSEIVKILESWWKEKNAVEKESTPPTDDRNQQIDECQKPKLDYLAWHLYADRMESEGQRQVFCRTCCRWKYPDELCDISEVTSQH